VLGDVDSVASFQTINEQKVLHLSCLSHAETSFQSSIRPLQCLLLEDYITRIYCMEIVSNRWLLKPL